MRVVVVLCCVLIGGCWAVEDGQPSSTEEEPAFTFTREWCPSSDPTDFANVLEFGNACFELATLNGSSKRATPKTLDEFRDFFRGICGKQETVRGCLRETAVNMEICKNATFSKIFAIYGDTIETVLNVGCVENGEKLANVSYEFSQFIRSKTDMKRAEKCGDRFKVMFNEIITSDIDISSKLYNVHGELNTAAECLYGVDMTPALKDGVKHVMDAVLDGMKCIHPVDGTLVPCVGIDVGTIETSNVCDVMTFGTGMSLYDVLEEYSGDKLMAFVRYEDDDLKERIRGHVEQECEGRADLPYFLDRMKIVTENCLNATEHAEFVLFTEDVMVGYNVICRKGDGRFVDLMFEVYRLKRTGQGHAVWACLDVVKAGRNVTDDHASRSKNMRFYHELESFGTCLVGRLHGDQTSVHAATSLIDEVRREVKCLGPEEGSTVFCETLVNTA